MKRKYCVTTQSKHHHLIAIADNVLNRQFNPSQTNQAWVTDITYGWTVVVSRGGHGFVFTAYRRLVHGSDHDPGAYDPGTDDGD